MFSSSFSLSFRPSQSPSDDLGCFFRIEKVETTEEVRIPVQRARARAITQQLHERARAPGFGICEEEEEEEAACVLCN